MKRIIQITEVIDNLGGVEYISSSKVIKKILEDPACWSDDMIFTYEMNGGRSVCFIDDLVGQEVIVGNEIILVQE